MLSSEFQISVERETEKRSVRDRTNEFNSMQVVTERKEAAPSSDYSHSPPPLYMLRSGLCLVCLCWSMEALPM